MKANYRYIKYNNDIFRYKYIPETDKYSRVGEVYDRRTGR